MAYTTQTMIENYLQRTLTANEVAWLAILIPAIKIWLDRKLNSTFDATTPTTRYYDGGGRFLDIDPATTITAVQALNSDGSTSYEYDLTVTPDVLYEPRGDTVKREIRKRNGHFPSGIQNIAVTATFTEFDGGVPQDIQLAATTLAAEVLNQGKMASSGGNVKSESLEGHTIHYDTSASAMDAIASNNPNIKSILDLRRELYVE